MLNNMHIILVEPQLSENVGMAARAMMNCGLTSMRLVNPREDHLSQKAISASSNAEEILYNAKVFQTLDEAIEDVQFVLATTSRKRGQTKTIYSAEKAMQICAQNIQNNINSAVLFGPERTGLYNDDVCKADAIINIPLNPKHCSLNLSQAVLLIGYEFFKTQVEIKPEQFITNSSTPAQKEKLLLFLDFLEKELSQSKVYGNEEKKEKTIINLRNIFTRNSLTEQEINTLYGVVNYLKNS